MPGSGTLVAAGGLSVTSKRTPVSVVGMSIAMEPSGVAAPLYSHKDQEFSSSPKVTGISRLPVRRSGALKNGPNSPEPTWPFTIAET